MRAENPRPRIEHLDPAGASRVLMTVSCTDADDLPKVADAGKTQIRDGKPVQVMHNGLLIEEGCYYGPWMTEIIRALHGHHEPQEEAVFHEIVKRLQADTADPVMIELGSFWAYYSMWFAKEFPSGRVVAMEPDPAYLEVGKRNWALNDLKTPVDFVHGAVGARPGELTDFVAESDAKTYPVPQFDLRALLTTRKIEHADLILCDTQGWETVLLERAREDFARGTIRFVFVSTHHHVISGSAVTHQDALRVLTESGAYIIAEHSVSESYSGDGLIVASFDERDRDWTLPVSHARARDCLFGEWEHDLDRALRESAVARQRAVAAEAGAAAAQAELERMRATKTWRLASLPRKLYGRLIQR